MSDDVYFKWLYSFIGSIVDTRPEKTYWCLAEQLHKTPFSWSVANDGNRAEDGKNLRIEFARHPSVIAPVDLESPASFLEVLIGLAWRIDFSENDSDESMVPYWFWTMLSNAGLDSFSDAMYNDNPDIRRVVDIKIRRILNREYYPDGDGGLFPLMNPREDQRGVEIWYQMSAYLLEQFS